jgi:hypothetical protein
VRLFAALDHLPHDRHPGGPQQLAQLLQVIVLGERRDAERALDGALSGLEAVRLGR